MVASQALLSAMAYQHTKTWFYTPEIFQKTLSITSMETNPNTGKVFWYNLKRKMTTYKDGS